MLWLRVLLRGWLLLVRVLLVGVLVVRALLVRVLVVLRALLWVGGLCVLGLLLNVVLGLLLVVGLIVGLVLLLLLLLLGVLLLRLRLRLLLVVLRVWLLVLGVVLGGLLVLGGRGVVGGAVSVEGEVPDAVRVGVDGLLADLAGLAVHPDDAAVVVDGVEDVRAAAGAVGVPGPGDEDGGGGPVPGPAEFVGDAGVAVLSVLAGLPEVCTGPVLDVGGAVALAADAVEAAVAVVVVGAYGGHLRVAVPGLDERAGAVGTVVGAARNGGAAVVLEAGPGLERVRVALR